MITFWDIANVYQAGISEEIVGRAIGRKPWHEVREVRPVLSPVAPTLRGA
ncbi:aldo/keto reductase [Streptomyces sp. NPDC047841]